MSFNLVFFNGDVRRDKRQEAMLKSMNERDNFLHRLREMEQKREIDEKQTKAVKKIQKFWRADRARNASRLRFRAQFDAVSDGATRGMKQILEMSRLLVNFYESKKDEERLVMTLVELVKARTADRDFERRILDSQRLLLGRCCVRFLNQADENTIFFHVFRFLEDYITCHSHLYDQISKIGLFEAEFHLLNALLGEPDDQKIQKMALQPRHLQLLNRIFEVFVNPSRSTPLSSTVADRLLKSICVSVSDLNFTNYILYYIKDHIRIGLTKNPSMMSNFLTLYEALKSMDVLRKWKLRPEQVESALLRLRAMFLLFVEQIDKSNQEEMKAFFDSVAPLLDSHSRILETLVVKEDLSETGRLRTTVNRWLWAYSEHILTSYGFRRLACAYVSGAQHNVNIQAMISMRKYFAECLDLLASSNSFLESLYSFISQESNGGQFDPGTRISPKINALELFCNCLNRRVSSVADSDFVPHDVFIDFDKTIEFLRDVSIQLVHVQFPTVARGDLYSGHVADRQAKVEAEWKDVTLAVFSILISVYQKDIRIKYFPEGFWTNHGREVLSGIAEKKTIRMPVRRLPGHPMTQRTVDTEFVERLAAIYENDDDSDIEDEDERKEKGLLPAALRRGICVMKNIPFIVPFMDRVQLFSRLLKQEKEKSPPGPHGGLLNRPTVTVRRDHIYMDAFEMLKPKAMNDIGKELKSPIRVKMVNWAGANEEGMDGGGIFREFIAELLKDAFTVDRGFFTQTEAKLLYPNPTATLILGADCLQHFQFIGRMLGKLIYEKQLQEVRFAEFFIAQLFEADKNKDVDLQHMKSFDPLIFKNLKALQKMSDVELEELQLDFSVVTDDVGLVRNVNLKPNGSQHRVTVDNVHEYIRLYVNYHLKQKIAPMVGAIRRGMSEVISIEWMSMFAPHELQILIAGYEEVFKILDMIKNCEVRFSADEHDPEYVDMLWDVVENLSTEDKMAFMKFVTGCSRAPVDGLKSLYPKMGILIMKATSQSELPTSSTCMNLLRLPKYDSRTRLEEKLRYAINAGAGFELI